MKNTILISLCILILGSCSKEKLEEVNLCDSPLCTQYYDTWKNVFISQNNMTEEYFNDHIIPYKTEISLWNEGESFRVYYQVSIDWMICKRSDQFIININSEILYPALNVNRGEYLTEVEINQVISAHAFSSSINVIGSDNQLKYSSKKKALKAIRNEAGTNKIDFARYKYFAKKPVFTPNGHPYMVANGVIDKNENKCLKSTIDLITGEIEINECPCWIE